MARHRMVWLLATALAAAPAACSPADDDETDARDGADDAEGDDDADATDRIEYEPECAVDSECDDRVDCTVDSCIEGLCRNLPRNEACQDGFVCNGEEKCDPRDGCVNGEPYMGCFDGDPCTADKCVEPDPDTPPRCQYDPLDRDGDTYVDARCGGEDCNDVDPLSYPGAMERCGDRNDNNCDGLTDADDPVCQMNFDSCDSPRELVPGVSWEAFTAGSTNDIDVSCDSSSYRDVAFYFDVTEPSDVMVSVDARDVMVYVAIETECGVPASELRCLSNYQVSIFERDMEAGRYYVVVSYYDDPSDGVTYSTFIIRLDVWPAGEPDPGDTCDVPIDLTLPAYLVGDLTRMDDDIRLSCSWRGGWADQVFRFALESTKDVTVDVSSIRAYRHVAIQASCADPAAPLACDWGYPFHRRLAGLAAGTYYIWVESAAPGEFTLAVTATDPAAPPANDTCAGAIDVSAGGSFEGTLMGAADDYASRCASFRTHRDVAYVLTLPTDKAVSLTLTGYYGLMPYLVVLTDCADPATERTCQWYGFPTVVGYGLLPAGTYYILVEGAEEGEFRLDVRVTDPVDPCAGLAVIDATTTVRGTTIGEFNDFESSSCGGRGPDRAYELRLASPASVVAEITAGSYDTVLHLRSACADPATEIVCNDDSVDLLSRITTSLAAGTYYLIVDGFASSSAGTYTLRVDITP